MATYKSGYKKRNRDNKFLTYVIVVFGSIIVSLVLGLILYNVFTDELKYDSFDDLTDFQEITTQPEEQYLVYFYGKNCGACVSIKDSVLDYFGKIDVKVYVIESSNTEGVNLIKDPNTGASMNSTPTLLTIKDGVLIDMNVGSNLVIDILKEIDLGTYDQID